MFVPLLADDSLIQVAISLIVVIVGVIGWIVNLVSNKNQPPQPPPRQRPRKSEARDESIFIEDDRRPSPRPRKPKPQQQGKPAETRQGPRPVGDMADRHIQTSNLGSGVRSHLAESQAGKLEQAVQKDMQPRVDQSVRDHLGAFTAASQNVGVQTTRAAQQIVQLLRNPTTIKQAMIVNTILSLPPALARKPGKDSQQP